MDAPIGFLAILAGMAAIAVVVAIRGGPHSKRNLGRMAGIAAGLTVFNFVVGPLVVDNPLLLLAGLALCFYAGDGLGRLAARGWSTLTAPR